MAKRPRCPHPHPTKPGQSCGHILNSCSSRFKGPGDERPVRQQPFRHIGYFCQYCGRFYVDHSQTGFVPIMGRAAP